MKRIKERKISIISQSLSIDNDFYCAFDQKEKYIKLCINDGAFKDNKLAFNSNV